jgi:hypothetical protein
MADITKRNQIKRLFNLYKEKYNVTKVPKVALRAMKEYLHNKYNYAIFFGIVRLAFETVSKGGLENAKREAYLKKGVLENYTRLSMD